MTNGCARLTPLTNIVSSSLWNKPERAQPGVIESATPGYIWNDNLNRPQTTICISAVLFPRTYRAHHIVRHTGASLGRCQLPIFRSTLSTYATSIFLVCQIKMHSSATSPSRGISFSTMLHGAKTDIPVSRRASNQTMNLLSISVGNCTDNTLLCMLVHNSFRQTPFWYMGRSEMSACVAPLRATAGVDSYGTKFGGCKEFNMNRWGECRVAVMTIYLLMYSQSKTCQ